jgi:eukaryotic-like serine/threonine-protein kinase
MLLEAAGEREPRTILDTSFFMFDFRISPDNLSVAYASTESGTVEVYVAPFSFLTPSQQVSTSRGLRPFWRKDGKELFYLTPDTKLMAVQVKPGPVLELGASTLVFQTPLRSVGQLVQYAVARDGKKFLIVEPGKGDQVGVILNWSAALR